MTWGYRLKESYSREHTSVMREKGQEGAARHKRMGRRFSKGVAAVARLGSHGVARMRGQGLVLNYVAQLHCKFVWYGRETRRQEGQNRSVCKGVYRVDQEL